MGWGFVVIRCFWVWMVPVHGGVWAERRKPVLPGLLGFGIWLLLAAVLWSLAADDEYEKGIWWMPWHQEAMKDVARCENLGGAASGR